MAHRHTDSGLVWLTFAISLIALVFALLAFTNSQNRPLTRTLDRLEADIVSGLQSISRESNQLTREQFDREINQLRLRLASQYQDAQSDVKLAWQQADDRLAALQGEAEVDLSQALSSLIRWLESITLIKPTLKNAAKSP